jgi:hypothetical protein
LNFESPSGLERSAAIENKSAHGEPVEPLERLTDRNAKRIVEHGQTEAFFCLEKPVQITAPIARKLQ